MEHTGLSYSYTELYSYREYSVCLLSWKYLDNIKYEISSNCVVESESVLCDPRGYNPPGFSDHGILQPRRLEWVVIPFSRGSSQLRDRTQVSLHCRQILYHLSHHGSPVTIEEHTILLDKTYTKKTLVQMEYVRLCWVKSV